MKKFILLALIPLIGINRAQASLKENAATFLNPIFMYSKEMAVVAACVTLGIPAYLIGKKLGLARQHIIEERQKNLLKNELLKFEQDKDLKKRTIKSTHLEWNGEVYTFDILSPDYLEKKVGPGWHMKVAINKNKVPFQVGNKQLPQVTKYICYGNKKYSYKLANDTIELKLCSLSKQPIFNLSNYYDVHFKSVSVVNKPTLLELPD